MRLYVKVADAIEGVGFTRGYWTHRGLRKAADALWKDYQPAVWVYTADEKRRYEKSGHENGTPYTLWLARNYSK